MLRRTAVVLLAVGGLGTSDLAAQERCPGASAPDAEAGWQAYRAGDLAAARTRFEAAIAVCAGDAYARAGLGYVALREGRDARAEALFREVLVERPEDVDAHVGLGILAWRAGDLEAVRVLFERVTELAPGHPTAVDYLSRLGPREGPPPERPPLELPDTLEYPARTRGSRFEVRGARGWKPFYVKGMNLGAALPGRHPGEFPDSATYAGWIAAMADMNVNTIRVYTIHPPGFYQALQDHNDARPDEPMRLIHGVWTELPEAQGHDYLDPGFEGGFFEEMRRVVDVVHGRADVPDRPGHASGYYTADVARWVLAYVIGREWEPHSVIAFDTLRGGFSGWPGAYVALDEGRPMEAWLTKALDEIVAYETDTYRSQRPVAYTNWPTLDPMDHVSEAGRAEEVAIREALGETVDFEPREYDNDVVGLDATRMRATPDFPAGLFAVFHAYPYYPDFMLLGSAYAEGASSLGPSRYFGYLSELRSRHPSMPLLIAEYGVPASLGSAHLQPEGFHHGGLSERAMAEVDRRLTLELAEAGMAGGALFAWIDEWFKRNWLVTEFELPRERNRLWYNRLDAEQHYGMLALEARAPVQGASLGERRASWARVPIVAEGPGGTLRAAADAAYLWLYLEASGRREGDRLLVGIDVIDPDAGDHRWPGREGPELPSGIEFALVDEGGSVRLLADPPVNPFQIVEVGQGTRARPGGTPRITDAPPGLFSGRVEQRFNLPYVSVRNTDGVYDSLRVVSNRRRVGRDSVEHVALGYDRGVLPEGGPPDGLWERDGDAIEIRIPWLLLNVTDPSSRSVLAHSGAGASALGRTPDGLVVLPSGAVVPPDTLIGDLGIEAVPDIGLVADLRRSDGTWASLRAPGDREARFTWAPWGPADVVWSERRRPVFETMRRTFGELDPFADVATVREPRFRDDPADEAWRAGDTERALALYTARLGPNPDDEIALHRVALMRAWVGRYDDAIALFDRLLAVSPVNPDARVDRARVRAWRGEVGPAVSDLDAVLRDYPDYPPALEARATLEAWAGRYDAALASYEELLAIAPDNRAARRQQAQILAWASRLPASREVYAALLEQDPGDVEARLGLARVLTYADDLEGALAEYRRVLDGAPDHVGALEGLGRALSWGGELVEGEAVYRRAVERSGGSVSSLVGLAQNLRWQGREAAALEVLERAARDAPTNGDVREQLRWVRVALGSRVHPRVTLEEDSDGNRMVTSALTASWHPVPRLDLTVDAYQRSAEQAGLSRSAYGLTLEGSWQFEPGWSVSAALGGSEGDGSRQSSFGSWRIGVASPPRLPYRGALRLHASALDATALLVERGVRVRGIDATGSWTPAPRWRVHGTLGRTVFESAARNRRLHASAALSRRLARTWTVGVGGRTFGFQQDLAEGYFDPDFYGIVEATGRWLHEPEPWSLLLEAAPGVQQVTEAGSPSGAFRASARLAYRLGPGREISVAAGYSSTGLQSFSTGASDYRYTAFIVGGSWVF